MAASPVLPRRCAASRAMVAAARRLVILADHTKWRTVGLSTIAKLDQADTLISDDGLPDDARTKMHEHITNLIITSPTDREP
jgi:DeoR/GlpR family transcriptional regulator of sugar metabolism